MRRGPVTVAAAAGSSKQQQQQQQQQQQAAVAEAIPSFGNPVATEFQTAKRQAESRTNETQNR